MGPNCPLESSLTSYLCGFFFSYSSRGESSIFSVIFFLKKRRVKGQRETEMKRREVVECPGGREA